MTRLFEAALGNRLMTTILVVVFIVLGLRAMVQLPIDAVPDVTPNVVQIVTNATGLGPTDVEKFVTFPVELAMRGLPGIKEIRSLSRFGLSAVFVYFDESYDIYFARRLVMERLPSARELIPQGFGSPEMTPVSTSLGEIFQFEVVDPSRSLMELRSLLDWQIAPRLKSIPGVVEVNSYGGELKTYEVQLRPSALVAYNLSLEDVFSALEHNNASAGGGYIVHRDEQELIRGSALIESLADVGNIVVASRNGIPIYIRNLGKVAFSPRIRNGAVTRDGKGETVAGIVMMLIGENSRTVVDRVEAKVAEIAPTLPKGVKLVPYYDRAELVRRTIDTVAHNLAEGAILVTVVLFLFLGNIRASLITASVIPLSMLAAFIGMRWAGVSGNLMSLGAIDFGLIVDGSVVMIENIIRRLDENPDSSISHRVFAAGLEVLRPIVFAIAIIIVVYLPILSFQDVEGKMFRPMALTVIFALSGSLICALTLVPVMASLLLKNAANREPWVARQCARIHQHLRAVSRANAKAVVIATCALLAVGIAIAPFLGAEFIPSLDEGTILLDVLRDPSVSLEAAIGDATKTEKSLLQIPEVARVISRTGRPEIATDTMGPDESDTYVLLKPRSQWRFSNTGELIEAIEQKLGRDVPETNFAFTQPIEERVQDMLAGIKADVAVHVYGDDLDRMVTVGRRILKVISQIPGAADPKILPRLGLPSLTMHVDREAVARYGINASDVLDTIETIGGKVVGQVVEDQARYSLQVRFDETSREDVSQLAHLQVAAPSAAVNVRGSDLATFVSHAKRAVAEQVELPEGWRLEWGGQYENLQRASAQLLLLVPASLFLIFVLLYNTFSSMRIALLIFTNVLLAATGGIFGLALRGLTFSITAGVGFITLSGVSVLNGVVLASEINRLLEAGQPVDEAIEQGCRERFRPIMMASLVALFGFIPMALSHSAGAELQSPLATVVIGGLIISTPFTLYVLPILYQWMAASKRE
jgi:cobalt-zinc-cadmium resistance protein CzcA